MSVTPQILTNGRRATFAGSSGRAARRDEGACRGGRVRGPDEGLADERTIEPERPPAGHGRGLAHARFGDDEAVVRDELAESRCPLDVHVERPQVAVVEPDESRPGRQRAVELAGVVDLDQRLEADLEGALDEPGEPLRRMQDGQQQDEVRAGGPQHRQLDVLDDEVLGQDRDGDRRPDRPQVVHRPAEPVRLAQDGDRGGAAGLVGPGARDDVLVVRGDPPGRRRRALDLGDEVQPRCREPVDDRSRTR